MKAPTIAETIHIVGADRKCYAAIVTGVDAPTNRITAHAFLPPFSTEYALIGENFCEYKPLKNKIPGSWHYKEHA